MSFTNEITKNAVLGTDKMLVKSYPYLNDFFGDLLAAAPDREDGFLKMAAAAFLYEEAGSDGQPLPNRLPECPRETLPTASEAFTNQMMGALVAKEETMFDYCVWLLEKNTKLASSSVVPALLNKALTSKAAAARLVPLCGNTGRWLCELNEVWRPLLQNADNDDLWETGTLTQRKSFFTSLRKQNPKEAITQLSQTIQQENAQGRQEFVELLEPDLSLADEPFLTSLLTDTGSKVRRSVHFLLKKRAGSQLNQQYFQFATLALMVKKDFFKGRSLDWNTHATPPEILFKTGIEKVSNEKGVDDLSFWIAQTLEFVEPSALAGQLNCTESELLQLFFKHPQKDLLLPYLAKAAVHFGRTSWAQTLLEKSLVLNVHLLRIMPATKQSSFYPAFFQHQFGQLFQLVCNGNFEEMEADTAIEMLRFLAKNPYQLYAPQYQLLAFHLPEKTKPVIEKHASEAAPQQDHFKKNCLEMIRIIEIKKSLQQSQ